MDVNVSYINKNIVCCWSNQNLQTYLYLSLPVYSSILVDSRSSFSAYSVVWTLMIRWVKTHAGVFCSTTILTRACICYWQTWEVFFIYLVTYLDLSEAQVVLRSATKFLQADLFASSFTPSSRSRFFYLILRVMTFLQMSLGLPTLRLPEGVQLMACSGSLYCGIRSRCPYHPHRQFLITSNTDCWPFLLRSSTSLTWSTYLILRIFFKQPLSNLLTWFSFSFSLSHDSH